MGMAVKTLNGSTLGGATIKVTLDQKSQDSSKLIVSGIPPGIEWQELKDHFKPIGTVAFAEVRGKGGKGGKGFGGKPLMALLASFMGGGGGKGFGGATGQKLTGEVRYDDPLNTMMAAQMLNGSYLGGSKLQVDMDWSSQDMSKLWVGGIPAGTGWQDLKDHFAQIAPVAFANIKPAGGKGKGKK